MIASADLMEVEVLVPHKVLDDVVIRVDDLLELLSQMCF